MNRVEVMRQKEKPIDTADESGKPSQELFVLQR